MENLKKKIAIILTVFIIALNLSCLTVLQGSAAELRYGKTIISSMENSAALTHAYNSLADGLKITSKGIVFDYQNYSISPAEFQTVYNLVVNDYPEYFWIDYLADTLQIEMNGNSVSKFTPAYGINGNSLNNAKAVFNSCVNNMIQDLGGKSDYEKSLILHDRVLQKVSYAFASNNQSAYGAIAEGKAVCAGYARAYQHLLHKVGIPAWCVTGESYNPISKTKERHAWNLVQLDGNWYYTDVTWDDQDEMVFYSYLNCTKTQFDKDHFANQEFANYLPNSNSTDANYFERNNLVYSSMDIDRISANLKANNLTARIYVDGDVEAFKSDLNNSLPSISQLAGLPEGYSYSTLIKFLGNEIVITLKFVDPNHRHNLTFVKGVAATGSSKGNKEYYKCSCGKWFSDANAENEITDKASIEIPVKVTSSNSESKPVTITPSSKSESTVNSEEKTSESIVNSSEQTSESTVNSEQVEEIFTDEQGAEKENSDLEIKETKKSKNKVIIPIIIGGIILIGGGTAFIIFKIKRK